MRVAALRKAKKRVRLDPVALRLVVWTRPRHLKAFARGADPCLPLKAIKNTAEIRGSRTAHIRDGAALFRFLAWLDR